jgi:SAM-dependent methyltransferase
MKKLDKLNLIESGSSNLEFMKHAINYNEYLTQLLTANITGSSSVLDFGAGTGEFASRLTKQGFIVDVLEIEPNLLTNLKGLGFKTLTSLAEIPNSSYSTVYSLNVLEHVKNDSEIVKLITSKLQQNGKVVFYLPAFEILYSQMDVRVGHYRRYTKKSLGRILVDAGLEIQTIQYADFFGFFATLVYKFTPNRDGTVSIPAIRFYDSWIFPMNRIFDRLFQNLCGKNVFAVAIKV